ncbi:hypothetical protein [Nannocystis punicea]|uniref:Uncharacterized protein n=1 Tax=Nannocystis punicea TaxID=2995304 RepID=A0ABY7H8S1_9BACT|nr:hypothetical protein [Nannocystis poenicansa]WAS95670.1 hypothetical protein O0S08_05865 [Nannocystis poenicansa]
MIVLGRARKCQIDSPRIDDPASQGASAWRMACSTGRVPIEIDHPCTATPEILSGPPELQHCAICQRDVHNLSMMSEAEARAFIRSRRERGVCVRIDRAADGTERFRDLVPAASLKRRLTPLGVAAAIVTSMAAGVCHVMNNALGGIGARDREHVLEPTPDAESLLVDQAPSALTAVPPARSLNNS